MRLLSQRRNFSRNSEPLEDPIAGVTGELVADAARSAGARVTYVADKRHAPGVLARLLRPGDLALTIGAGDVTAVGPATMAQVMNNRPDSNCQLNALAASRRIGEPGRAPT